MGGNDFDLSAVLSDKINATFTDEPVKTSYQECLSCLRKSYVTSAYFARIITTTKKITFQAQTVVDKKNLKALSKKHKGVKIGETVTENIERVIKELIIEKNNSTVVGDKVYIIIETAELRNTEVTVKILGSNNTTFVKPDEVVSLLLNNVETTTLKAKVGEYAKKSEYHNAATFNDKAIIEIDLKPNGKEKIKGWVKKIKDSAEKSAFLHLSVTAESGNEVWYSVEDDDLDLQNPNKDKGVFLNKKDQWFTLYGCYCSKLSDKKMFEIDDYIRLGLSRKNAAIYFDTINQTFQKYNINSCIRIAHFLAQVGHESGDFVFLKELWGPTEDQKGYERDFDFIWPPTLKDNTNRKAYGLGNKDVGDGKKFMGRGAIQITGRNNYEDYGLYVSTDFIEGSNNENLKNLPFCIDSAGWFWSVHLNVDLNTLADKNDITHITKKINGGVNGLADRKARLIKILNIMEFCLNHDPINIPTNA